MDSNDDLQGAEANPGADQIAALQLQVTQLTQTISLTMVNNYASWFGLANLKQNLVVCSICVNRG